MGRRLLAGGLALIAVALIVLGRTSGGAADVLTKAINICTECIGLG
ncbi:MAG: thioredoxin [Clostridia bacterium]|nr:thioredoxin [Clostridia bacterium]